MIFSPSGSNDFSRWHPRTIEIVTTGKISTQGAKMSCPLVVTTSVVGAPERLKSSLRAESGNWAEERDD